MGCGERLKCDFGRDWAQVSGRKIRNQYGDEESNIVINDGIITFTRGGWSNVLGHRRSNLQRVQYLVVDNKLLRRHWRSLDQGIGEEPLTVVLLNDVESMDVAFLDALEKPLRVWPPDTDPQNGDPIALVMQLDLPGIGEIRRVLEVPSGAI